MANICRRQQEAIASAFEAAIVVWPPPAFTYLYSTCLYVKTKLTCPSILYDWVPEQIAILCSAVIVCVMGGILHGYDGAIYENWPLPLTLNATISLLVTMLYMLLMVPVSSCLGQCKWNIFRQRKPFRLFKLYEEAGRSIFGAIDLLRHPPCEGIGPCAALLFVMITAIGPFSQQIISVESTSQASYPLKNIRDPWMATVPVLKQDYFSNDLQFVFYSGLFSKGESDFSVMPDNCENANCTWKPYTTLAVRRACVDISKHLSTTVRHTAASNGADVITAELPNGFKLNLTVPSGPIRQPFFPGATNLSSSHLPISLADQGNVLLYASVIHIPRMNVDWNSNRTEIALKAVRNVTATECMLQTVARPLTANSTGGIFREYPARSEIANDSYYAIEKSPWRIWYNESYLAGKEAFEESAETHKTALPVISYDVPPEYVQAGRDAENQKVYEYTFASDPKEMAAFAVFLTYTFDGSTDLLNFNRCEPGQAYMQNQQRTAWGCGVPSTAFGIISSLLSNLGANPFGHSEEYEQDALSIIDGVFNNVANSLTTNMRLGGINTTYALGSRNVNMITYSVAWQWMSIPVGLCGLVALMLAWEMYDTRAKRMPVEKNDSNATAVGVIDKTAGPRLQILDPVQLALKVKELSGMWVDDRKAIEVEP